MKLSRKKNLIFNSTICCGLKTDQLVRKTQYIVWLQLTRETIYSGFGCIWQWYSIKNKFKGFRLDCVEQDFRKLRDFNIKKEYPGIAI